MSSDKSRAEDHRVVSMVMFVMKADQEEEESLSQQNSPHVAGQKDQKQNYRNQNHKNTKPVDLSPTLGLSPTLDGFDS